MNELDTPGTRAAAGAAVGDRPGGGVTELRAAASALAGNWAMAVVERWCRYRQVRRSR